MNCGKNIRDKKCIVSSGLARAPELYQDLPGLKNIRVFQIGARPVYARLQSPEPSHDPGGDVTDQSVQLVGDLSQVLLSAALKHSGFIPELIGKHILARPCAVIP